MTNSLHSSVPSSVTIRTAVPSDLDRISQLCTQFGFPAEREALKNRLNRISSVPSQVVFVAESKTKNVIGWVHAYEAPSLLSDATVEIGGLIVDQESRRQGVGRALMQAVEQWTQKRGFNEILLATRIDRKDAQAFYKALGFEFVHTTHFLSKAIKE